MTTVFRLPARGWCAASLLTLCLAGCGSEQAQAPAGAPPAPAVTVTTLQPETVTLTRQLAGRATPFAVAEVRPQVSGIVQRRLFTEGGEVAAGQPLYQLDDATYRADHARAKAALTRAQAVLDLARANASRTASLAKQDAVSREEAETAAAALAQAEAEVGVARAALASAEVLLGYTTIRSPIAGRIGRSAVTAGALVTANQTTPLATVQQLHPIYVDLNQSSRELVELRREIAAGNLTRPDEVPVEIVLEDGTPYPHEGKLAFTEMTVDPLTGSVVLRAVVPNPEQILLPGTFVRATVATGVRDNAILAPQQGIARDPQGNATALVVVAGDKVELRPVRVSRTIGDKWLVESGLALGDRLIVEGLQKVRPGATVRVTERAGPAGSAGAGGPSDRPAAAGAAAEKTAGQPPAR